MHRLNAVSPDTSFECSLVDHLTPDHTVAAWKLDVTLNQQKHSYLITDILLGKNFINILGEVV